MNVSSLDSSSREESNGSYFIRIGAILTEIVHLLFFFVFSIYKKSCDMMLFRPFRLFISTLTSKVETFRLLGFHFDFMYNPSQNYGTAISIIHDLLFYLKLSVKLLQKLLTQ